MRIAFMGTRQFSVPILDALIEAGHDIAAVYTQPPRPAGRGKTLAPSAVQRRAEALGLDLRTPSTLRTEDEQQAFFSFGLDAAVVAAYGLILPRPILEAPRLGALNVHASLLPRWRGAAPVQRAILAGDQETGVCIMAMEAGLDTGPVLARAKTPIDGKTAGELTDELAVIGSALMTDVLGRIDRIIPEPQPEDGITYASKIGKQEARIDFSAPAEAVERQIRAFNPWPGAWFEYRGERIRILAARLGELSGPPGETLDHGLTIACGSGSIVPTRVQRSGRAPMTTGELLRGFVIPVGARLGSA